MTIAEKIARAKNDLDEVYEAGRNSVISGVGTVVDNSVSVFKQVPVNSISHCYISSLGGYTHEVPDDSTIFAPIRLENAKPMGLKVHGANWIPYPYAETTKTVNGITFTDNGDGTITINGTATDTAVFALIRDSNFTLPKDTYTLSGGLSQEVYAYVAFSNNGTLAGEIANYGSGTTKNTSSITYTNVTATIYVKTGAVCNNLVMKPMLNMGTVALPYSPYHASVEITLPESITSLANFGLGLYDNEYNEVDLVNGKYTQRCDTKTLVGTESYSYYKLGSRSRFQTSQPTNARYWTGYYYPSLQKCDYLECDTLASTINANDTIKNKMLTSGSSWFFYVDGTSIPDLDSWKAYLAEHNMEVVYELENEVVTDIDISGFNPLIEVEAGGAIEFITDSGYAPNSTVVFQTIM